MRPVAPAIVVWLVGLVGLLPAQTGEDARVLAGLRARGLFQQAAQLCLERLADKQVTESERAALSIELSRIYAEHALAARSAEAPRLWQQSQQVVETFARDHPRHPRLLLVRLQGALALAAQGGAAREEAEAAGDPKAVEAARAILRTAIGELKKLSAEIDGQLRRSGKRANGELSQAELQSLEVNLRYELARALREQALCYPSGTADGINSLSLAVEQFRDVAGEEPRTAPAWAAALEEIACLRLLGEFPQTIKRIEHLEKQKPETRVADRLRAERIRLALARGSVDEALSEARAAKQAGAAELELARLEALLAGWQTAEARREPAAAEFQKRAVEQSRAIQRVFGPREARTAERLLSRALAGAKSPESADALAEIAAGYYRQGKLDRAVAAYDRAIARAREENQSELAFDLGLTAATIEKEQKQFRRALDRYRALATGSPGERKAAESHLLAVYCAAQLAQGADPPNLDEYEKLLQEHVATWPNTRTAAQAWTWLGRLAENRGQWQAAIDALKHVPPGDPQYAEAAEAIGRSYEAWLAELHAQGESGERLADEALAWCEQTSPKRGKPNAATRAATLVAARVWLMEISNGALPAERLLSAAIERNVAAPPEWKAEAERLLVAALAAQGKAGEAEAILKQAGGDSVGQQLAMFETLDTIRRRLRGEPHPKLAEMELALADRLLANRQQLDAKTLANVTRTRALALAALGRRREAVAELEKLARANPRDGQTPEELATLLMQGEDADLQAALTEWSAIAKRSRPGTPRWYRAQLALARTQLSLGQVENARTTIAAVAQRYPDFGNEGMKRQFETLATELQRPDRPRGK